ncbi:TPA: hypothetical protein ACKP3A_000648 [Serratia marcescens]
MTHSAKLFSQIQMLEVELHQSSVRRDPQRVAALLHEDFEEIARQVCVMTNARPLRRWKWKLSIRRLLPKVLRWRKSVKAPCC